MARIPFQGEVPPEFNAMMAALKEWEAQFYRGEIA